MQKRLSEVVKVLHFEMLFLLRCFVKNRLVKIGQNLQENACDEVSF